MRCTKCLIVMEAILFIMLLSTPFLEPLSASRKQLYKALKLCNWYREDTDKHKHETIEDYKIGLQTDGLHT